MTEVYVFGRLVLLPMKTHTYFWFRMSSNKNTHPPPPKEVKSLRKVKLCPTLCDSIDCSLPGFSIHGIFQARVPEWVAISFSRGSSQPRDQTQVFRIAGRRFTL